MQRRTNRHISAQRALQLNDSSRIRTPTAVIRCCIDARGRDVPLLDLSDFGLRTMITSGLGGGAQECDELGEQHRKFADGCGHRRAGRQRPPPGGCQIPGHTRTCGTRLNGQCHRRCRGNRGRRALLRNIGRLAHIQEALSYFCTVRSLVKRGVVSPAAALSVPACANVMACVVEFDDGKVGVADRVSGFRHSAVNYYGDRYHAYDASLPLRQYRYKRISKSICVAKMSCEGEAPTI